MKKIIVVCMCLGMLYGCNMVSGNKVESITLTDQSGEHEVEIKGDEMDVFLDELEEVTYNAKLRNLGDTYVGIFVNHKSSVESYYVYPDGHIQYYDSSNKSGGKEAIEEHKAKTLLALVENHMKK